MIGWKDQKYAEKSPEIAPTKTMGQNRPPFVYFHPYLKTMTTMVQNLTINRKSMDGELGLRTRNLRMVGTNESTELWLLPPK